ncbi:MAG: hypothetical protein ABJO65_19790 [Hyphomicrobiales bacterium]
MRVGDWRAGLDELEVAEQAADADPTLAGMTFFMYGSCLGRMAKGRRWKEALEILERMRARGMQPDTFCLSAATKACGACKKWQEALALLELERQRAGQGRVDNYCMSAAVYACGNAGQTGKALELLEEIKAGNQTPHSHSYTMSIDIFHSFFFNDCLSL